MDLLRGPYWLNDQIIAFYFQYLELNKYRRHEKHLAFISPSVTQLLKLNPPESSQQFLQPLKLDQKKLIFFALNDHDSGQRAGGTHWSLLVYSRVEDQFYSFDSFNNYNNSAAKTLVEVLKIGLSCPFATFHTQACTQQTNFYDCGIHVLANAENICEHFLKERVVQNVPRLEPSAVANKRQEILNLISSLRSFEE